MSRARSTQGPGPAWAVIVALAGVLASACAGGARAPSTRLAGADFRDMTASLAAQLSACPELRDRTPDSPAMTIAMDRVENLTTDIITEGEGWHLMDRVRNAQDLISLSRERNVRFVIPAPRVGEIKDIEPDALSARAPTHALRATIRSVTRQAGADRTEAYDIEYRLMDIATSEVEWTGSFIVKRAAVGKQWD